MSGSRGTFRGTPSRVVNEQRRPKQLSIATSIALQSGITADVSVTGLAINFTVTDFPVEVEFYIPWITVATAAAGGWAYIADAALTGKAFAIIGADLANGGEVIVKERITVPGAYSRIARVGRTSGTGTISILGDTATIVGHLKAQEYEV